MDPAPAGHATQCFNLSWPRARSDWAQTRDSGLTETSLSLRGPGFTELGPGPGVRLESESQTARGGRLRPGWAGAQPGCRGESEAADGKISIPGRADDNH